MSKKYLFLLSLSGFIFSFDQFTKHYVSWILKEGEIKTLPLGLKLIHEFHEGYIFGLVQDIPIVLRNILIVAIPLFALLLIALIFLRLKSERWSSLAVTLIFSGALSNMIDRVKFRGVLDIVEVGKGFPSFNIADISILIGVFLMFIGVFSGKKQEV